MKNFKVEIRENLSRIIYVKANNEYEAYDKAQRLYDDYEIVLDSSDCLDFEIVVLEEVQEHDCDEQY